MRHVGHVRVEWLEETEAHLRREAKLERVGSENGDHVSV